VHCSLHAAEAFVSLFTALLLSTHSPASWKIVLRPQQTPVLQHMGVELDEQNRRVDAVGARAENTHYEIRSARSRSMGTHLPQDCLAAPACCTCCDGMRSVCNVKPDTTAVVTRGRLACCRNIQRNARQDFKLRVR
jgi:hypothetical protein